MTFDPNYGHFNTAQGTASGFAPAQGSSSGPAASTEGLRNWWKWEDDGTWTDSGTGANYWTENNFGDQQAAGKIGYSIDFPRTSGYGGAYLSYTGDDLDWGHDFESAPYAEDLPFTFFSWVYPEDDTTFPRAKTFFHFNTGFYYGTGTGASAMRVRLSVWRWGAGGTWRAVSEVTSRDLVADEWNCIYGRYQPAYGTGDNTARYHCGVIHAGTLYQATETTMVGGFNGGTAEVRVSYPGYDASCRQDCCGFYTRQITDDELLDLYNATNSGTDYPF